MEPLISSANNTPRLEESPLTKKIIFIMPQPPDTDFQRKYFVKQLITAGFVVMYWDVGPIFGYASQFMSDLTDVNYLKLLSYRELKSKLKEEGRLNVVFVPQITRSLQSLPIYLLLNYFKKKTVFFGRGYLPFISQPQKNWQGRFRKIRALFSNKRALLSVISVLIFKCLPVIKKHDRVFVDGKLAAALHAQDALKLVNIHHFDIDCSRSDNEEVTDFAQDYCVFIDNYLPFHPDFHLQNCDTINPDKYYPSLNCFFEFIEKHSALKVVIAAHPKAEYKMNPFNGRTVLFDRTHALVKNAKLVFAHASTAISYAVVYQKPICLLFSDEIKKIYVNEYQQMVKTQVILNCSLLNVDTEQMYGLPDFSVDKTRYAHYYAEFLSNTLTTSSSSEVVIKEIQALLDEAIPLLKTNQNRQGLMTAGSKDGIN